MAKLQLTDIGIFVKDLKAARSFYTKKIGLKVRESEPKWGYLTLGATKGGEDAALNPWQPVPEWGQEDYEKRKAQIGGVTGIGFSTSDMKRTVSDLRRRGVKVEIEGEGSTFARFSDPDGNVLFLAQPARVKARRAGIQSLAFVTVVSRDTKRSGEFFRKALAMKERRVPGEEGEEDFVMHQLSPKATGIAPFTPTKEMYDDPSDYDADMAHIGEDTAISFTTNDLYKLQEALMAKGVRFQRKAEKRGWGGLMADFLDPDDNVYSIMQPRAVTERLEKKRKGRAR